MWPGPACASLVALQHPHPPCAAWLTCAHVCRRPIGRLNFDASMRLALAGTIQFTASLQAAHEQLAPAYASLRVPQSRPLSPGAPRAPQQLPYLSTITQLPGFAMQKGAQGVLDRGANHCTGSCLPAGMTSM